MERKETLTDRTICIGNSFYFVKKDGSRILLASCLSEQINDPEYDREAFCDGLHDQLFDLYEAEGKGLIYSEIEDAAEEIETIYRKK